jgi:hypothetical protein
LVLIDGSDRDQEKTERKEAVVIPEDAVEKKPAIKKRILVGSLLALAAMGTHWLPGRTIVTDQPEPRHLAMVTTDSAATGPNTLLGDTVVDKTAAIASSANLSQYHLDMDDTVDQAALSRLLNGITPEQSELAVTEEGNSVAVASAVPEPTTAGIFLLAATPVLIRRKARAAKQA